MSNVSQKEMAGGVREGGPRVARCRDCGSDIYWAKVTRKDGTTANRPFDALHSPEGTHQLRRTAEGETWADWVSPKQRHFSRTLRVCHFDACPMRPPRNG